MSGISSISKRVLKGLQGRLISKSWDRKIFFLRHDYPGEISVDAQGAKFSVLDVTLKRDSFEFVLDCYAAIRELKSLRSAAFYIKDEKLFVAIGGIVVNPTTSEEFFILNEIFVKGVYNFDYDRPCSIIDVGMNVGIASLFFASSPHVDRVFAFEPFAPTFAQGQVNIDSNPDLSKKMLLENYGLGAADETLEVAYDYSNKGQVGIHGTSLVRSNLQQVEKQKIEIRDASRVLGPILKERPGTCFVLKLDCEGSEYGIMQNLADNNLLVHFKLIFIEWHDRGAGPLLAQLRTAGFISFYQQTSGNAGMIYASR